MIRLLIVDDNAFLVEGLWRLARALRGDWQVHVTTRSVEAVDLIARESIDVLVTDILMPGKDGFELIREARGLYSNLKIVAMSGGGELVGLESLNLVRLLGANATLVKPFSFERLVEIVLELVPPSDLRGRQPLEPPPRP